MRRFNFGKLAVPLGIAAAMLAGSTHALADPPKAPTVKTRPAQQGGAVARQPVPAGMPDPEQIRKRLGVPADNPAKEPQRNVDTRTGKPATRDPGNDLQQGREVPRATTGIDPRRNDSVGSQEVPRDATRIDVKGNDFVEGVEVPRETTRIDPQKNDPVGGTEVPRDKTRVDHKENDILEGKEVPREQQMDPNNHLPARKSPSQSPTRPSQSPRPTPAPANTFKPLTQQPSPQSSPRIASQPTLVQPLPVPPSAQRRYSPPGSIWRGPRYTNAYDTSRNPPTATNYGSGTGRSGPEGQRRYTHSPGYGQSSAGPASSPSSVADLSPVSAPQGGTPSGLKRFGYDDNMPKSLAPPAAPKGVLMRLGIDPSTFKTDEAPAGLLDRLRADS